MNTPFYGNVVIIYELEDKMCSVFKLQVNLDFLQVPILKASAHSFKCFTSRLLKLYFSLSMHLLPRMNVMLDFI